MAQTLLHLKPVRKLVTVAVALNNQIAFGVLQLLFKGNQLLPLANANAKQPGQRAYHFCRVAHPLNRIQRVVQKVGVNLRLQGFQLGFTQLGLLQPHLLHKLFNAAG